MPINRMMTMNFETRPCNNPYLPIGYKLTDTEGRTVAVLDENRRFVRWHAGTWAAKWSRKFTLPRTFKVARGAAKLRAI